MCGIAGILQAQNRRPLSEGRLLSMMASLKHRGPDESGIYMDSQAMLGHMRLSIIDLAGGTQPIHNEDETLWIIFNGEIFNYPELRETLERKGHHFYTTSDTEVIIHLYEEKGADSLLDLNGQFAFAIWDTRDSSCFIARDRVGIRPLFFTEANGEFLFASEIKALFADKSVPRQLDHRSIDQIFTFWTTLPGSTPFKGIRQLPPGHYIRTRNGKPTLTKYWDLPMYPQREQLTSSPDQISEKILSLLTEATRIRLRADVPVGTYLSGGLDSSALTSLVARNFHPNVKTFGIRFDNPDYDEGLHQQTMSSFLQVDHTEEMVSDADIAAALPNVVWHSETPLLRTAPAPLYLLSKAVREHHLKVVLTGEGSDEIFGGYNIFRETAIRRFWSRFPNSQRRGGLICHLYPYIFNNPKMKSMLQAFFAKGLGEPHHPFFSHLVRWNNTSRLKRYFTKDLSSSIGSYSGYDDLEEQLPATFHELDHLSKAQYLETTIFMSNYLLSSQGDRMAMGNSLEIRLPYLDVNVMEYMGQVPSIWKILGIKEKYILRKAFSGLLPESIAKRPKHPYRAPIKTSLLKALQSQHVISDDSLRKTGLFKPSAVHQLLRKMQDIEHASETDEMALTGIVTTQLTHEQFIENFNPPDTPTVPPRLIIDRR